MAINQAELPDMDQSAQETTDPVEGSFGAQRQIDDVDWNFPLSSKQRNLHNVHPYPAKFIPEIPRELIRTLGVPDKSIVFDPFCGSGVTLVEAQSAGYESLGVDLNPIACLISRVKTQNLDASLDLIAEQIVASADNYSMSSSHAAIPNLEHWFRPEISLRLSQIVQAVDDQDLAEITRDAFRAAISSIIVRVSNQESDTRYAAKEHELTSEDVTRLFLNSCYSLTKFRGHATPDQPKAQVIQSDILELSPDAIESPVGLVITSPPYPAAYEYWLYHKYRMYWLGYDPVAVREKEIGARPHYFKKNPPTPADFEDQIAHIMWLVKESAVQSAHVCFVVGPSKIKGEIIDNAAIVEAAAKRHGFRLESRISRQVDRGRKSFNLAHARIDDEAVLIFSRGAV